MTEEHIIGAALKGDLMHALLLSGPDRARCNSLARRVCACFLFGEDNPDKLPHCPDFLSLEPPHTVDAIRDMVMLLSNRSFSENTEQRSASLWDTGGRRCVLIGDAHTMNTSSQNALLKALEEPPERVLFVLVGTESGLLQTIRSRSAVIRLGVPSREETARKLTESGIDSSVAALCGAWSDGLFSDASLFATEGYRSFRQSATRLFFDAVEGTPRYNDASALLKNDFRPEGDPSQACEKPIKPEAFNAPLLLDIWVCLTRDAIVHKLSIGSVSRLLRCPDAAAETLNMAQHFTFSQLEGIIEMLDSGMARLNGSANPSQTVDLMLTGLPRKEK